VTATTKERGHHKAFNDAAPAIAREGAATGTLPWSVPWHGATSG